MNNERERERRESLPMLPEIIFHLLVIQGEVEGTKAMGVYRCVSFVRWKYSH